MSQSTPDFDSSEQELSDLMGKQAQVHPPLAVLLAFEREVLPAESQERVRLHVGQCASCTMLLLDLATLTDEELSPAQEQRIAAKLPVAAAGSTSSRSKGWMGIAAAVLVCVTAGLIVLRNRPHEAPVAQVEKPAAPLVAALEIPLAPLAPPDDAEVGLSTRGANRRDEPSRGEMMPAFLAYDRRDYPAAENGFTKLEASYPKSGIVPLYLGVSQLLLKQDEAAAKTLAVARSNAAGKQADAARWYSAIAAQRLHSSDAKGLLQGLCADKSSTYAEQSCRIAATLP